MAKKNISWKTQGMNRDISVSSFNTELAFENVNLRLSTNDGNTLMSWVNEKGPKAIKTYNMVAGWNNTAISAEIKGTVIGTAVINHQLVLFTTLTTSEGSHLIPDRIYVLKYMDDDKTSMSGKLLFEGNLNLHQDYPLETIVSYEANYIQKVYWTDNRNQPRFINIAAPTDKLVKWNANPTQQSYFFDFVPTFNLKESDVSITQKSSSGGIFAPGVIQYVFTYVNNYGQESNIAYQSALYYLTYNDRAASPEEKMTACFIITVNNTDTNFDYLRIYSIQRTSLNDTPFVKLLSDVPITGTTTLTYVDNGTTGSTVDPTELLYKGGLEIKALTMVDKDNTLFLGNITQQNSLVSYFQNYYNNLRAKDSTDNMGITFKTGLEKTLTNTHATGIYSYTNTLSKNRREITTFKGGETYRFGFQLQKRTGEWLSPIFMNDVKNTLYPNTAIDRDSIFLPYAEAEIDLDVLENCYNVSAPKGSESFWSLFKSIRPVIVYPTIEDRNILCQGVINPTVFNVEDRVDNSPFAQASWFFRPYIYSNTSSGSSSAVTPSDLDTEVTIEEEPSDVDTVIANSIDSYFSQNNLLNDVYIMVADVYKDCLDIILSRKYLTYYEETYTKDSSDDRDAHHTMGNKEEYFNGAIVLGATNAAKTIYRCAFIKNTSFTEEDEYNKQNPTTGMIDYLYRKYLDGEIKGGSVKVDNSIKFKFYSGMENTLSSNLYYYPVKISTSAPDPYIFMFKAGGYLYTVKFPAQQQDGYMPDTDGTGNALRFKHYDSLYTLDDITDANDYNQAKNIEIEGSIRSYTSVFDNKGGVHSGKSNTQFFVDQSILTFNSPDLELDTEVQTYGWEGVKLRVIGVIPITAYQSSHNINISSSMLEEGHNNTTISLFGDVTDSGTLKVHFGAGETDKNIIHNNISLCGGQRLISDYFWNDVIVYIDTSKEGDEAVKTTSPIDFLVYPWQKTGSLNNDTRAKESTVDSTTIYASSYLETKREGHLLYSLNTSYFSTYDIEPIDYKALHAKVHLTENSNVLNMRLSAQKYDTDQINYYPNIDKVLVNTNGYKSYINASSYSSIASKWPTITRPISIKYRSTTHAIVALRANNLSPSSTVRAASVGTSDLAIPIMPYGIFKGKTTGDYTNSSDGTFWGKHMTFNQESVTLDNLFSGYSFDYLWLAEVYKDVEDSRRFGGKDKASIAANDWTVCGEAKSIDDTESTVFLKWTEGDTYYQRYDCLKTFPFTNDDPNQITEILSFMCETHTNIDGRYDKNRGQTKNYLMKPDNFNLVNPVYSQQNNFFTSKISGATEEKELSYPNHLYYTKTKESGANVDLWTNVTLASTLELDGDKGEIRSLNKLNDQVIAFQDTGIAQILYNENTQISTTEGVPIEIANSGKVQGKRYLSNTIGCSNKWSIVQTPSGIYFMDNNDKSIYLFNGKVENISTAKGFNTWAKQNIPSASNVWTPVGYGNFRTVYDKLNQDVLFINGNTALAYSEKLGMFTSFYDYGGIPFFENFDDTGVWIKGNELWKHQAGDYCNFFGEAKPFSMTLVASQEPQVDKIFTNLEFRATVEGEGSYNTDTEVFSSTLPFDTLEVWNEYQHGILNLVKGNNRVTSQHGKDTGVLSRKYRMWRCDIPRDNAPVDETTEAKMGIKRFKVRPLDRIRNPWAYLKLQKNAAGGGNLSKVEIHDIMATYFG